MNIISSDSLSTPAGHYSHGIAACGLVFVSGQLPFAKDSRVLAEGIAAQTLQALHNVEAVLLAAGSSRERLLSVQVYVTDIALWPEVNRVYAQFMGDWKPSRAVIPCPTLHHGALIEIAAIAQA